MKVQIKYDGSYPNLCSGELIVIIDGVKWIFPEYCLDSGGGVYFDDDWGEHITKGNWTINKYPEGFPKNLERKVLTMINKEIPPGCCGGCV